MVVGELLSAGGRDGMRTMTTFWMEYSCSWNGRVTVSADISSWRPPVLMTAWHDPPSCESSLGESISSDNQNIMGKIRAVSLTFLVRCKRPPQPGSEILTSQRHAATSCSSLASASFCRPLSFSILLISLRSGGFSTPSRPLNSSTSEPSSSSQ